MRQKYSSKNKKTDLKISISIGLNRAWKNRKSMILDQVGVKEIFYDKNVIFGLLDENIVNWSLYKFTYTET